MHCPLRRIDHVTDHRALPGRGWRMRASATETPVCEASRFSMSNAQFRENTLGKDCRKADQFATLAIGRNLPNVSLNLACEKREARGDHLQNGDSYKPRRTFQEIDGHGRQGRNAPSSQCGNVDQPVCLHVTNAVSIDPKSDIHCSVLSFYFHGLAKYNHASDKQVFATRELQDWYARKIRSAEGGRYSEPAVMQSGDWDRS